MAKAVAKCRCATCGNDFTKITVKPNRREADSWEEWAVNHCDECEECRQKRIRAEREEESRKAAEAAKEINLPELAGSEKQIAWAERIRMEFIQSADREIQEVAENPNISRISASDLDSFKGWMLKNASAKFWIDNRETVRSLREAIHNFYKNWKVDLEASMYAETEPEEATTEIVEPEQKKSTTVCTVEYTDKKVCVISKYDPEMPPVVKAAGYKWDGAARVWTRAMDVTTGAAEDRAAEIANKLLCAGFPVQIPKELRDKAVSGSYEPEHKRWITWLDGKGLNVIGDVVPKGIPGIKYSVAPIESYAEVEEFARLHDYRLSPGAEKAITAHKARVTKAAPVAGKNAEYKDTSASIKNILGSSRDVLDDLKEEE